MTNTATSLVNYHTDKLLEARDILIQQGLPLAHPGCRAIDHAIRALDDLLPPPPQQPPQLRRINDAPPRHPGRSWKVAYFLSTLRLSRNRHGFYLRRQAADELNALGGMAGVWP